MSFVIRITFLIIGVALFDDIACTCHKQQGEKWKEPQQKDPVAPTLRESFTPCREDPPSLPNMPGKTDSVIWPGLPSLPALSGKLPKNPHLPSLPVLPGNPDLPSLPAWPGNPNLPSLPAWPENPDLPSLPAWPQNPDSPSLPAWPENSDLPSLPAWPESLDLPSLPALPENPEQPSLPALPGNPDLPFLPALPGKSESLHSSTKNIIKSHSTTVAAKTPLKISKKPSTSFSIKGNKPGATENTIRPNNPTKRPRSSTISTGPTTITSESNLIGWMTTFASYLNPSISTQMTNVDPEELSPTPSTITTAIAENITPEIKTTTAAHLYEVTPTSTADSVTPENTPETSTNTMSMTTSYPTTVPPEASTSVSTGPTNESSSTEVEPELICPGNQSRISETDLELIVEKQIRHLQIAKALNDSFFYDPLSAKDSIKEDLQEFLAWLEGRPSHLKHILQDLTKKRNDLDKIVRVKAVKLQEYEVLENEYKEKVQRLENVNKKIDNAKMMCKLNCEEDLLIKRLANGEKYHCSHIDALYDRVDNLLVHHLNNSQEQFRIKILNDTKMYKAKVENLKKELKSIALSQFGKTMYDVFNLQDQFHHFSELVNIDLSEVLYNIKVELGMVENGIIKLNLNAEKLRKHCRTCQDMRHRRLPYPAFSTLAKGETKVDLVGKITLKGYNKYGDKALTDYQNIFSELDKLFAEQGSQEEKIAKLKPLQEEIEKMTAEETKEFKTLKEKVPKISLDKVAELTENSMELNKKVDAMMKELAEKYVIFNSI